VSAVFVDTGYWIALLNPRDTLHSRALDVSRTLGSRPLLTSEMVLAEWLNDFAGRGEALRRVAVRALRSLSADSRLEIFPQTSALFQQAANLYAARSDKGWSLTDCSSFAIMEQRSLQEALTYDRHFEQAGFVALLRP
jgi:predicted nucleic acid-binding protein